MSNIDLLNDGDTGFQARTIINQLVGLVNTSGVAGTNGTSGVAGISGVDGIDGLTGTSGTSGTPGTSGTSGEAGATGSNGTSGTSGVGTSGSSGTSGLQGPPGNPSVYKMVVNLTTGSVNTTTPVASITAPDGSSIYDGTTFSAGWNATRSTNSITVTHPLGLLVVNPCTHGVTATNTIVTRSFTGTTAGTFSCIQASNLSSVTFNTITGAQTGAATTGNTTVTISFQFA
jgi:hypothetical protein